MKKIFLIGLLLCPILLQAQSIEENSIDPFTGKRDVFTDWLFLNSLPYYNDDELFMTKFVFSNDNFSFRFKWIRADGDTEIKSGSLMALRLNTGEIFGLRSRYDEGKNGSVNTQVTLVLVYNGDLSPFGRGLVTDIRIYTTKGYVNIGVKEKRAKKLFKQYQLFQAAVNE